MMKDSFLPRREFILSELMSIDNISCVTPNGAFYVFPNMSAYYGKSVGGKKINGSVEMSAYLLEESFMATVPGAAFGADEFVRFSFASSMDNIKEGMNRLKEAIAKLA